MSFLTQKQKYAYIKRQNKETSPILIREVQKNKEKIEFLDTQLLSPEQNYKNSYTANTDWELMTFEDNENQHKKWLIEFPIFDYRFLPFINTNVLIRNIDASFNDEQIFDNVYKNKFFVISDIEDEEYLKKVQLSINIEIPDSMLFGDYIQKEARLLLRYVNPIKVI